MAATFTTSAYAAGTDSITITANPGNVFVLSTGSGLDAGEYFGLTFGHFNGHTGLGITTKLTSVQYSVASYPAAISDHPKMCYYTPYSSTPIQCIDVAAGTTGTTTAFNNQQFGPGARISIMHKTTGTPGNNLKPSGPETVVFNYSY
ncbi:hypothetical protein WJ32_20980 [Burkholderia ubonensis]|uniref:Uncharacterized protein n=1 Tax=Burkholderia ubonensis TaxID=101571 RepID=A0A124R9V2_9BURK|nr:hypothetical protein WJ32_20980 [Burkholderia ubonensis]KVG62566.1 hypothetical protein WJ33_29445 [Burkholderia ubonensis]